ncbi:DNRLRE domain-containing protein [Algibacter miyuki]|uniref:DNRLRE domain-containing protein n=1 Tax=Algibacter miyuki TaxID=1306933 RepID=A0ABV5H0L9_9FLAO|nr:DNRLRE domain-containing protein [Algibacter miyuki]MDN3666948.1 DNRLRE domain-containing protein [Algibacter miyuki]
MKTNTFNLKKTIASLLFTLCFSFFNVYATDYYIDATNGDDSNNGTSASTAWETLAKVNTTIFQPGDAILFKAGESWYGTIKPQGSGAVNNPIVMGKYGSGANPAIHGDGTVNCSTETTKVRYCTLYLNNQEYWEIRDLELTNFDSSEEGGISLEQWEINNTNNYANVLKPEKYAGVNSNKVAILVEAKNMGAINQLHFINLEIHGVNGDISDKDNGGIFLEIYKGDKTPTYFDDLLFENCYIHDVDRTGLSNVSYFDTRTLTENTNWTPTLNFVIRNCTFEKSGANALIFRAAENPIVEHNLFTHCSIKETGNAAFNFNTDNAVFRFNEARFTKYNVGDNDAGGLDSDYRTKNTTLEYNYIHDNDFGILITGGPGSGTGFNDNTIFRYNILENDGVLETEGYGAWAFKISGNATNTHVYNNVIYVGTSKSYTDIVYHKNWNGGQPDGSFYHNNIFYNEGADTAFNITTSTNNYFSNNLFYGNTMLSVPLDINKIIADPKLSNPGGGESGYTLASDSPALASGVRLSTTPDKDFYQNTILEAASIDIGVEQITEDFVFQTSNNVLVMEDSFVRGGSNYETNYDGTLMEIKESSTGNLDFARRVWLKFDVSAYSNIAAATLHISGNQSAGTPFNINVNEAADLWTEETITWDNAPAVSSLIGTFATPGDIDSAYQDLEIDITNYVKSQIAGDKIVSLNLAAAEASTNTFKINHKENTSGVAAYIRIQGTTLGLDSKMKSEFVMFPNPAQESFLIQTSNAEISHVKVLSINGSLLYNINDVNSKSLTVDVSNFQTGVYFVHIKNTQGELSVEKLIKN